MQTMDCWGCETDKWNESSESSEALSAQSGWNEQWENKAMCQEWSYWLRQLEVFFNFHLKLHSQTFA